MSAPPQQTFPHPGVFLPLASTPNPTGFVPPPPCLPQLRCLPPPPSLPPPPPPPLPPPTHTGFHANNWTNPTITYTRVTVEDLFASSTVTTKMPVAWPSSMRSSQLNPNANPFQPAYQRPQTLPPPQRSQPTETALLAAKSAVNLKPTATQNTSTTSSETLPSTLANRNLPQNTYVSRGTMYFGQTTTPSLVEEGDETAVSDEETGAASEKKPKTLDGAVEILKPVPKRDIARMMWEAADLYDNAIRAIQEKRAELQKRRERKMMKADNVKAKESTDSSEDIDPEAIVRDIVKSSHRRAARERKQGIDHCRKPFIYLMRHPYSVQLDENRRNVDGSMVRYDPFNETKPLVQADESAEAVTGTESKTIRSKSRSVSHIFIGKEVTVDEIASAIIRMETDLLKRKGASLQMTKASVISVIEEVQRYIIDQLKLDPEDFVSVRLQSTASTTRLILNAQDQAPRMTEKIQKIQLEGAMKLCKLKNGDDKCIALRKKRSGILTYEGKEVTVGVIVKAIAKMIREIYGKKPKFRISRSGLTEFITNKQEKILKALKLKSPDWTLPEELQKRAPSIAGVHHRGQNVEELPATELLVKTAKIPKARRKIKPIFIRRKLSSKENKKTRKKKKPRPPVNPAESFRVIREPPKDRTQKTRTVDTAVERVDKEIMGSVQSRAPAPTHFEVEKGEVWSTDEGSYGTDRSDSSRELLAIRGKFARSYLGRLNALRGRTDRPFSYSCNRNSRYRGRLHKMFLSEMSPRKEKKKSPKKKTSTKSAEEERLSSANPVEVTAPVLADYSSIHGRMAAAPTNIVIRTVEKKSKKRGKKGWRKSWI